MNVQYMLESSLTRYLIVGGSAFFIEYTSFIVMYSIADFKLWLANSISFLLGLATSFIFNRLWSFNHKSYRHHYAHQLLLYVSLSLFNLMATLLLVSLFKNIGIIPSIGKIMAMIITSLWNFVIFKRIIFKNNPIF